jgi:AcrR family transcriptional regulator
MLRGVPTPRSAPGAGSGATPSAGSSAASGAASGAAPSRRERPAKPALSRDAIVAAGLDLLRREGIAGLTMRRLAQALDTGPASLYVYVANRQELIDLLFDAAIADIEVPPLDPPRWREQLKELSRRMVDVMVVDYPGLAELSMAQIPTGENSVRLMEAMLGMVRAGGVEDQAAAYAGDLLGMYVTAIAYEQTVQGQMEQRADAGEYLAAIGRRFAELPAAEFPNFAALAPLMMRGDPIERFELGMDVLINGLLATPTEGRLTDQPWMPGD